MGGGGGERSRETGETEGETKKPITYWSLYHYEYITTYQNRQYIEIAILRMDRRLAGAGSKTFQV